MGKVLRIERMGDPARVGWAPVETPQGYQLVNRAIPWPVRNHTAKATFVGSLDEAAKLIAKGHGIRMAAPGKRRGGYIFPGNLLVVRA